MQSFIVLKQVGFRWLIVLHLLTLRSDPEDEGDMFLQNVGIPSK
jgi:hypothetical protein